MKKLNLQKVNNYILDNIDVFHKNRIEGLSKLKLREILQKKNPYLFKVKYLLTSEKIVTALCEAFITSKEETIFGDWLEGLAIFVNENVYSGRKSGITGVDLEFDNDGIRYIINIKSGPNWGNSRQIAQMKSDFTTAKKTLRTSKSKLNIIAINGCCYGRCNKFDMGEYYKYCGQKFWQFISNESELYRDIIIPLGHKAKERNEQYLESYSKMINVFTREFTELFCSASGEINWDKLVQFNSGMDKIRIKKNKFD